MNGRYVPCNAMAALNLTMISDITVDFHHTNFSVLPARRGTCGYIYIKTYPSPKVENTKGTKTHLNLPNSQTAKTQK